MYSAQNEKDFNEAWLQEHERLVEEMLRLFIEEGHPREVVINFTLYEADYETIINILPASIKGGRYKIEDVDVRVEQYSNPKKFRRHYLDCVPLAGKEPYDILMKHLNDKFGAVPIEYYKMTKVHFLHIPEKATIVIGTRSL